MFAQFRSALAPEAAEVGAGIGTFSERLLQAGVQQLLIVEPDPGFARSLERRFGTDRRVRLVRDEVPGSQALRSAQGSLGLVLCQNVLEHLEDDGEAIAEMGRALRPGGRLAILVPAHPRLFGSLDRAYGHHRRYTRERLARLIDSAGLRLLDLYSFNLLGVPGWWLKSRLAADRLGSRSLAAYEALVPLWRPVEARLSPRWGLSLIAHAERPWVPNAPATGQP